MAMTSFEEKVAFYLYKKVQKVQVRIMHWNPRRETNQLKINFQYNILDFEGLGVLRYRNEQKFLV